MHVFVSIVGGFAGGLTVGLIVAARVKAEVKRLKADVKGEITRLVSLSHSTTANLKLEIDKSYQKLVSLL